MGKPNKQKNKPKMTAKEKEMAAAERAASMKYDRLGDNNATIKKALKVATIRHR